MIEVVGHLITELAAPVASVDQDSGQVQKQISGLYDLLIERMLDVSSYVRTKVLSVLSKLCELKPKFPKQRLAVTRAAVRALEDKAATVRKNAAVLLVKLLVTHPYGLVDGGTLNFETFEKGYKDIKEQLDKLEGAIGNAVERQQTEEGDDEDGDDDAEGKNEAEEEKEEGQGDDEEMDEDPPSKKKAKRAKKRFISVYFLFNETKAFLDQRSDENMIWMSTKRTSRMTKSRRMKTMKETGQRTLWTKTWKITATKTMKVGAGNPKKRNPKCSDVNPNLTLLLYRTSKPQLQRWKPTR